MRERGSSIIEFSLVATLCLALFGGLFECGHLFLDYYLLQHTVRRAAEWAAATPYESPNEQADDTLRSAVQNIVVFGEAAPRANARPLVAGLKREDVELSVRFENSVPVTMTVGLRDFEIRGLFRAYRFTGKPKASFPYLSL